MNAQKAGVHRIKLCTELSDGGITPSYGFLKKVMAALTIPVHVLIRPRSGNFTYSDSEFKIMKEDIRQCKDLGCAGIVSGVLHANNTIDIKRTKKIIELSKPRSFTFHRTFDEVPKPKESLLKLINIGVDRLLTSSQKDKTEDGLELLIELQQITQNKLIVMPGSGINQMNSSLFKNARLTEIHSSASREISENTHSYFGNTPQTVSDIDTIKNILDTIA